MNKRKDLIENKKTGTYLLKARSAFLLNSSRSTFRVAVERGGEATLKVYSAHTKIKKSLSCPSKLTYNQIKTIFERIGEFFTLIHFLNEK